MPSPLASRVATAYMGDPELLRRYQVLYRQVQEQAFTLKDLLEGRTTVNVEGDGGRDVFRAKQLGLFTCNVKGVDIIAKCEADAAPLIHYLEQGGVYGSLDFSRLLGYSEDQIAGYAEMLKLQAQIGLPPWGFRKATLDRIAKLAEKRWGGFTFKIDRPKGFVKTWDQPDGSVKEYTYPVDYGYFVGHTGEDEEGLDAFVGSDPEGPIESFLKLKPDDDNPDKMVPDETKFMVGLTPAERKAVLKLYKDGELVDQKVYKDVYDLMDTLTDFRTAKKAASRFLQAGGKYDGINFQPPKSVAEQAEKGLKLREKASPSNRGGLTSQEAGKQGIGSGVQRAVNLKNRDNVTPETIGKMLGFFARHEKNKGIPPEHKDEPWNAKGYVAWLLWGGDAGRAWAKKVKDQMDKADAEGKTASVQKVAHLWLHNK